MDAEVISGTVDGFLLLPAQLIGDNICGLLQDAAVLPEIVKHPLGGSRVNIEPFRSLFPLDAVLCQVTVEIGVTECIAAPVIENSILGPFYLELYVHRMCLLVNTGISFLLGISYLAHAVVTGDLRRCVAVYDRDNFFGCLDVDFSH